MLPSGGTEAGKEQDLVWTMASDRYYSGHKGTVSKGEGKEDKRKSQGSPKEESQHCPSSHWELEQGRPRGLIKSLRKSWWHVWMNRYLGSRCPPYTWSVLGGAWSQLSGTDSALFSPVQESPWYLEKIENKSLSWETEPWKHSNFVSFPWNSLTKSVLYLTDI